MWFLAPEGGVESVNSLLHISKACCTCCVFISFFAISHNAAGKQSAVKVPCCPLPHISASFDFYYDLLAPLAHAAFSSIYMEFIWTRGACEHSVRCSYHHHACITQIILDKLSEYEQISSFPVKSDSVSHLIPDCLYACWVIDCAN